LKDKDFLYDSPIYGELVEPKANTPDSQNKEVASRFIGTTSPSTFLLCEDVIILANLGDENIPQEQ
jgi:hypothetical protein